MKRKEPNTTPAPPRLEGPLSAAGAPLLVAEEEIEGRSFAAADFAGAEREHLFVQRTLFSGCQFAGSRLRRAHFADVLFRRCDLSNADWQGCSFQRVAFEECKLLGADLQAATWHDVLLLRPAASFANLFGGRMRRVAFERAVLRSASLAECRFEGVRFAECDLTGAELRGTRLDGVSLADSCLDGVQVGAVASPELRGLRVTAAQAAALARLMGLVVEEP